MTGAGGSIGARLAAEIARRRPARLVLLDHAEGALVEAGEALAGAGGSLRTVLGDVCDATLLADLFAEERPHTVFHAAALKQLPLLEREPLAALRVNALGTRALLAASAAHGAACVVHVSTDKAVAPTSVLGLSKRIAELLVQAAPAAPRCVAVRLGNVLGTRGSVVPRFDAQVRAGGPLTVTHPEATRYFVEPERAVALLLEAATLGEPGDVLVPELDPPRSILALARERSARAGRAALPLRFCGLRPGEKLHEALCADDERLEGTAAPGVRRVKALRPDARRLERHLDALAACVARRDAAGAVEAARALVPGFAPSAALRETLA